MRDQPESAPLPAALAAQTTFLMQLAVGRAQAMGESVLVREGISGREYGVLAMLEARATPTQRAVGAALGIDRTTTTSLLAALEQKGLVARAPQPGNRRANAVTLTESGELLRRRAATLLAGCEEQFLSPLSGAEQSALRNALLSLTSVPSSGPVEPSARYVETHDVGTHD